MAKILIFDMLFKFESLFLFVHVFFCCFGCQIQRTTEMLFADKETFVFLHIVQLNSKSSFLQMV